MQMDDGERDGRSKKCERKKDKEKGENSIKYVVKRLNTFFLRPTRHCSIFGGEDNLECGGGEIEIHNIYP